MVDCGDGDDVNIDFSVNILKVIESYTSNEWIVYYLNYILTKLLNHIWNN